jgi:hypothetical protein
MESASFEERLPELKVRFPLVLFEKCVGMKVKNIRKRFHVEVLESAHLIDNTLD